MAIDVNGSGREGISGDASIALVASGLRQSPSVSQSPPGTLFSFGLPFPAFRFAPCRAKFSRASGARGSEPLRAQHAVVEKGGACFRTA